MKKLIITLVLILAPTLFYAQQEFDRFEDAEGVDVVVINKKMIDLVGEFSLDFEDKDAEKFAKLAEKMDGIRIFLTKEQKYRDEMKRTVSSYLKNNKMDELMRVKKQGKEVKVFSKQKTSDTLQEMLVFVEGNDKEETVLISLTGNFEL